MAAKKSKKGKEDAKKTKEEPVELTPKQLKEKKREEARARAAESRKIVAVGVSQWTGKLPAQLLNELCQKLKWERVDYPIKGGGESFSGAVILGKRNLKTQQVEHVRFDPPKEIFPPQKTALEARHLAATYALHRIMSHKNMKMMLPPFHRDLWIKMDDVKKAASTHEQWKWQEDPFSASTQHKKDMEQLQRSRADREKITEERKADRELRTTLKQEQGAQKRVHFNASLSMSRDLRIKVEQLIRTSGGFEFAKNENDAPKNENIVKVLVNIGFESFQVQEALEYTSTLSDCASWLLVHVPEVDLPDRFKPKNLALTARVSSSMKTESAVAKLQSFGFSEELAREALVGKSTAQAMCILTNKLIGVQPVEEKGEDIWEEEMESLSAVYDGVQTTSDTCVVNVGKLTVYYYRSNSYPASCPGIGIEHADKVPKYILLYAIRRVAEYAQSLLGDFMIFSLTEWLQENIAEIISKPCKLVEISGAVNGVVEAHVRPKTSTVKASTKRKKRLVDVDQLAKNHDKRFATKEGDTMLRARHELPAWKKHEEIEHLIDSGQVVLITGETGSGKSTQVVQFILDQALKRGEYANIVCTQPRRISAIGVAQRVADERLVKLGTEVGYIIRGENKTTDGTQIRFVTSGVLLRMIQMGAAELLETVTHIVVDEVHERSLDSDFLLILLKRILAKNKKVKLILMSATVDPKQFIEYFDGKVGYTHIEGRTFPVTRHYLDEVIPMTRYVPQELQEEGVVASDVGRIINYMRGGIDYDFVARVVETIHTKLGNSDGSILVFMSGAAEIDKTLRAITGSSSEFWALPLHASLPPAEQRLVFKTAPAGLRKVVVSTNVAETSITISDIVAVVDSGRVKDIVFDPDANVMKLVDSWASRAAVTQRMGRAGRVRAGDSYALYTENIESAKMEARPVPEMLRCSLDSLVLSVKAMGINNVQSFLNSALDPPDSTALEAAEANLSKYGALDSSGALTPLGRHISLIPADPQTAKLLVLSCVFGCLSRGLTIAAILSGKMPISSPKEKRDEAKASLCSFAGNFGDLLGACKIFEKWQELSSSGNRSQTRSWARDKFVSEQTCRELQSSRRQFLSVLQQLGLINTDKEDALSSNLNTNNQDDFLVCGVVGGALSPKLIEINYPNKIFKQTVTGAVEADPEAQKFKFFNAEGIRVFVHPSSSLFGSNSFPEDAHFLSYSNSIVTTKHFVGGLSPLGTYALLFFANGIDVDIMGSGVIVDGWTGVKCWPRIGILVRFLKAKFDKLLEWKFEDPSFDIEKHDIMQTVRALIANEGT